VVPITYTTWVDRVWIVLSGKGKDFCVLGLGSEAVVHTWGLKWSKCDRDGPSVGLDVCKRAVRGEYSGGGRADKERQGGFGSDDAVTCLLTQDECGQLETKRAFG